MGITRIRMRKGLVYQGKSDRWARTIASDTVLNVPRDIDRATAKEWIEAGLAIEDKIDPRRLETKG